MKTLANIIAVLAILLFIYSILGRFVGETTIGLGVIKALPRSGIVVANFFMLLAIMVKLWSK